MHIFNLNKYVIENNSKIGTLAHEIKDKKVLKNKNIVKKLEDLKGYLRDLVQPRLAWEVTLLKIAIEDL